MTKRKQKGEGVDQRKTKGGEGLTKGKQKGERVDLKKTKGGGEGLT